MLLLPYHVDVPMSRWPVMNVLFIGLTCFVFYQIRTGTLPVEVLTPFILKPGQPNGIYGHMFLHFGFMHVIGNMVFLWVFGNAVCAKVGNLAFFFVYLILGCVAGFAHLLIDGAPAIGASGAVNGIIGMYLVFYPLNNVSCLYWFIIRVGTFYLSSIWLILLWTALDIFGAVQGAGGVAYWAHLGGFGAGFLLATALLWTGVVEMTPTERSLYSVIGG